MQCYMFTTKHIVSDFENKQQPYVSEMDDMIAI